MYMKAHPVNEPILSYTLGSNERTTILEQIEKQMSEVIEIPCIINGKEVFTGNTVTQVIPHKSNHVIANVHLAGKNEINLSKIVSNGLIDRTIEERQNDIKKGIYKEINSEIKNIVLESQTSSRIVALAELNYIERIIKDSGDFVNETSLTPLKVKYILGFSNKSWKLVDFVSGL